MWRYRFSHARPILPCAYPFSQLSDLLSHDHKSIARGRYDDNWRQLRRIAHQVRARYTRSVREYAKGAVGPGRRGVGWGWSWVDCDH